MRLCEGPVPVCAERSAINGSVFNTDFNNGHGMQYFLNGQVSRDMEWSNMNLQDFMPTWQWWVESEGTTALNLDWDYGEKQEKVLLDGTTGSFDYKQIGAYNGGSSLPFTATWRPARSRPSTCTRPTCRFWRAASCL